MSSCMSASVTEVPLLDSPRRVLIIRPSAIGDVVMASGIIPVLRAAWPRAHLAWLAEPVVAGLLRDNPRIDQIILWPKTEWRALWRARRFGELSRAIAGFRKTLRQASFDLVIDIQGLLKSGLLAWLTGSPMRIGLRSREGSQRFMSHVIQPPGGDRRIGSEYRYLLTALGLEQSGYAMDLVVSGVTRTTALDTLRRLGGDSAYSVLAPFTTRPQKHWFEDRWRSLAHRLVEQTGGNVVILGGPADSDAAERIVEGNAPGVVNLAGACSLAESIALIQAARLLVGVDTGLTHAGMAARIPTVALFGSTRPYLDTGYGGGCVLYHALACSPCRRRPTCGGLFTCMREHRVETVLQVVQTLMEGGT
jgi:heptosyltransferase-1